MIDSYYRQYAQKILVDPLLSTALFRKTSPTHITFAGACIGSLVLPFSLLKLPFLCALCLALSGYLDILDGSLARLQGRTSEKGAVLDICLDRWVEGLCVLSLFYFSPSSRAHSCLLMLFSILFCITTFLVVGIFTPSEGEKSFHYSPGIMERSEAFFFFILMWLLPSFFQPLALLFSLLVFYTAFKRLGEFVC